MTAFNFGDKVRATVELKRRHRDGMKKWVPTPILDFDAWGNGKGEREGIVIGKRTLANGVVNWGAWDESASFIPREHFEAYLVVYNMRRAPFLVLAKDLILIEAAA